MRKGFLNLADLGDFTAAAVENDTISFIASYGDGRVFTCNLAFCRLTGYSKDEVSVMKWPEVLGLAETVGGIEWYIVEQESYPYPPLESVSRSFANLKKILAVRR
jgi:PAS domain S-box-containing protein